MFTAINKSLESSYLPQIVFMTYTHVYRIFFISPFHGIRCGLGWSWNGSRLDLGDGRLSDGSIWGLARQQQDGTGWDGTDRPQKTEKYFSRFKRHASARVVGWIKPESRLRLFPGSAFFISQLVALYFWQGASFFLDWQHMIHSQHCYRIIHPISLNANSRVKG